MQARNTLLPTTDNLHTPVLSVADLVNYSGGWLTEKMISRAIEGEYLCPSVPQKEAVRLQPPGRGRPSFLVFSLHESAIALVAAILYREAGWEFGECCVRALALTALPDGDYIEQLFTTPRRKPGEFRRLAVWLTQNRINEESELPPEEAYWIDAKLLYPREISGKMAAGGFSSFVCDIEYYASNLLTLLIDTAQTNVARVKAGHVL